MCRAISCILLLFLASTAFCQPIADRRRALLFAGPTAPPNPTPCIASFTDPSQIAGLAFRWVASDQTNSTVLRDRVQGNYWVQNTGGNQPVLHANHLDFNGTSSFFNVTNVTLTFETNCSYYLIISTTNNNSGNDYRFMGSQNNLVCACYIGVFDGGTATPTWRSSTEGYTPYSVNNIHDFVHGVFTGTRDQEYLDGSVVHTNSQVSIDSTFSPFYVGKWVINGIGNVDFWDGAFYEMGIYTNAVFTADVICSLHYYATNTYPHTP